MNDSEFVCAVERCEFPKESFHHRDHIRLAWIYLRQCDRGEAERRMADTIRRFAAHHGVTDKYHETITLAWMRLVAHALAQAPDATLQDLVGRVPSLLDKSAIAEYYSDAVLQSDAAKSAWAEPDKRPLP